MNPKFRLFIINTLRKASYRWPARAEIQKRARIAPATFKCAHCGDGIYTGKKTLEKANIKPECDITIRVGKVKIDHIDPVIGFQGFTSWDDYINRMFCSVDGLQILCTSCHSIKSKEENKKRRENK